MELKSVMESKRNQGSVLKAILQGKSSYSIEGIYGRMGDLGAIDAKYDMAVSTACGGLDYIVVETTTASQPCVDIMILEKQTNHISTMKEKVSTPEGVPRLFDLIKVQDERMKVAFFAAIGNTVFAKDIDQGYKLTKQGVSIVKMGWKPVSSDSQGGQMLSTMTMEQISVASNYGVDYVSQEQLLFKREVKGGHVDDAETDYYYLKQGYVCIFT